jgi:nicotinamide-nucleotide amidase
VAGTDDDAVAHLTAGRTAELAAELVAELTRRGRTLAVAESLTGGLVGAAVTGVAGASRVLRGDVVAYATDLKHQLLGVDAALLDRVGAVHPDVARAMARGARERLGADLAVATTGVAGPDPQDGHPPGTVWIGLADLAGADAFALTQHSDVVAAGRDAIRRATARAAVEAVLRRARDYPDQPDG